MVQTQFPKDPELKQHSLRAINCNNFEPSSSSRVCSKHFGNNCFIQSPCSSKQKVKSDAVPNVSDVSETKQEKDTADVLQTEAQNEAINSRKHFGDDCLLNTMNISKGNILLKEPARKKRKAYVGDFEVSDEEGYSQVLNRTLKKKNKQIRMLQQKNRRLKKRIEDLHSLVQDLRSKHMITEDVAVILSDILPAST